MGATDPERKEYMDSTKRTAIITGAARGIGREIAISFYKKGYNVVMNYAGNDEAAHETIRLCKESKGDGQVISVKGDVSKEETAQAIVDTAMNEFGSIDVVVNNAGITKDTLVAMMKTEDFDRVIDVNLKGAFLLTQKAVKPMMKKRYGRIINISSVVGVHGNAGQVNYAASKAGLIGMTKSIAKELAGRNITANAVAPGMIDTDMTDSLSDKTKDQIKSSIPAGRMGAPEDIANAALFLADEKSGYITGQVLLVDGGMGM
ncbi:3-oxoacyl-[acyl-carrier-protein] reductase [Butyrivibrio sp. AE3006]|uniref:3-oxoacyl-[acyl-carrier-protein] reductase n=1 Tax=Butyrivibrio sp. AE3006 TaxID=1280673 RepID=UPI0004246FEC|nr:3-oxoacyl-[acyl-carrier-protein] reductase [Butyrivibrio sp. AE3006]